jgi:hypothetical protein
MKCFERSVSRVFALTVVAAAFLSVPSSSPAVLTFGDVSPTKGNVTTDFIPGTAIPENQFTKDTAVTGETVAIKARNRDTGVPIAVVGNRYFVSPGNDPSNSARTAWNFDFQFTPTVGKVATDYTYEVQADIDPGFGVTNFVTVPVPASIVNAPMGDSFFPNGTGGNASGPGVYSYNGPWSDPITPFVIANSENYKFSFLAGSGFTNSDPGEYELRFTARDGVSNATVASVTAFAVVPEPASASLLILGAFGLIGRRRRA